MTGSHSFLVLLMIFVNLMNGIKKLLVGDVFFLKEHTESLISGMFCIQDCPPLLAAAERGMRMFGLQKSENFADCIGTCTGNDKIGSSQQVTKFFFDEFILYITGDIIQFLLRLAFAAQMDNLEIIFNNSGNTARMASLTATAPRLPPMIRMTGLSSVKPQKSSPRRAIAFKELTSDRRT